MIKKSQAFRELLAPEPAKWGSAVNDVLDALRWSGYEAMINVYLLTDLDSSPDPDFTTDSWEPDSVWCFPLDDEDNVIGDLSVFMYDLLFKVLPTGAPDYLHEVLRRASEEGRMAWLGFEGYFYIDRLLTDDVASQIYGVCGHGGTPHVALDRRELVDPAWIETIRRHRRMLDLAA
ncbi:hypothetical protein [Saccharothrix ecbatanensis]|nr:hypothetical protein [Saccharothrix ecbatanensis]